MNHLLWLVMQDNFFMIVYGFIEPQTIQNSGNSHDHIKLYLQTWMTETNKEIYFVSYIDG